MKVLELINILKQFDPNKKIIFYKLEEKDRVRIKIEQVIDEYVYQNIIVNMDEEGV